MAAKKSSASRKKAASRAKSAAQTNTKKESTGNIQARAILLMALAVLLLCMAVFTFEGADGPTVWTRVHDLLHGLFGWAAVLYPCILGYVAVMMAREKVSATGMLLSGSALGIMLQAATYIFTHLGGGAFAWQNVVDAYEARGWGSGAIGALLGNPLTAWFSGTGAAIIVVVLIIVFLMLTTGTTLMALGAKLKRPVEKGREEIAAHIEERQREAAEAAEAADAAPRRKKPRSIDVELDGEERKPPVEQVEPPMRPFPVTPEAAAAEPIPAREPAEPSKEQKPQITHEEMEEAAAAVAEEVEAAEAAAPAYRFPPLSLLDEPHAKGTVDAAIHDTANRLVAILKEFGVNTTLSGITRGPAVTRFELEPSAGVKISRITGLADDIALRLAAGRVRIEAPIPNKAAVGIEIPNRTRDVVCLREVLDTDDFATAKGKLSVALGKDIEGHTVLTDLATMPHLLIAGTTGSGKSVCTNSMIQSILYRATPDEVKLILIDPKQVEFNVYNGIPHLLIPVVTDPRKAAGALGWAVNEMTRRYNLCAEHNVRDIKAYNAMAAKHEDLKPVPSILIVIDELADLMMAAASEVEDSICRLAQMARAAGMHMVIATQRPSVDVITGLIKANIPSRLALTVASAVDSRTIIDGSGAEKLLGYGDMLFMPVGMSKPQRVQGCYVSDREVESVVAFLKRGDAEEDYDNAVIEEINHLSAMAGVKPGKKNADAEENEGGGFEEEDDMLPQAIEVVIDAGEASTSMLQRRLRIGYARAGRLIDMMEQRGIVGPHEGSKPRAVLITRQQWQESLLS